ncbi:MAG: hypothetical protein AB203_02880 [Parcubacteria bacterium C7867-008]|nr:MAG: hypothetical protein AB203_02880 [Parcubacteria bacterium C7867-008]
MKYLYAFLFLGVFAITVQPVFADTAAGCPVFTRDLSIGVTDTATNKDVTALQKYLTDTGYLVPGTANGIFGPKTHAAVQAFQRKNGLSSQGYVGPLSRAKIQVLGCGVANSSYEEPLTLVGFDVPEKLNRGQSGAWILQFSPRAASSTPLDFNADWGDGSTTTGLVVTSAASATTTFAYFTHAYKKNGSYISTLTITPKNGKSINLQSGVRVLH